MKRIESSSDHPSIREMASFWIRSTGFKIRRGVFDVFTDLPRFQVCAKSDFGFVWAESTTPLITVTDPRERGLQFGKIQNLRVAAKALDGRVLRAEKIFSLWRHLGPPLRTRGYSLGREVRAGCLIPTVGGGLCQLSGAILEVAIGAGIEILERHKHTALPSDIDYHENRDATLFWNYIDLRLRASADTLIECFLSDQNLVVRLRGTTPFPTNRIRNFPEPRTTRNTATRTIESCFTCAKANCLRHQHPIPGGFEQPARSAYLMDEFQPEFDHFIGGRNRTVDVLMIPFSARPGEAGWTIKEREKVFAPFPFRLRRAWILRRSVRRGSPLAEAHNQVAARLAETFAKRIPFDVDHLCVSQTLLPYLQKLGVLGGRSFDVLMYRQPINRLQDRLDEASRQYPASKSLVDFRAPEWLAVAEAEGLCAAKRIISPHRLIAGLFPGSLALDWARSVATTPNRGSLRDTILFFGPTLARKGAFAVRDAALQLGLEITILGRDLEKGDFWQDVRVRRATLDTLEWDRIHTVMHPALIENWPRKLLRAHAAGARLIISPECGTELSCQIFRFDFKKARDDGRCLLPVALLCSKEFVPRSRQPIKARPTVVVRGAPLRCNCPLLLQPQQDRIKGPLID